MGGFDARVLSAHRAQLDARRTALAGGTKHVGWKVALDIPGAAELLGDEPAFGYLTSASRFESGDVFAPHGIRTLQVDCELAVELGRDVASTAGSEGLRRAITGVSTGIELCDVGRPPDDFDSIVAANVFHRGFASGPAAPPSDELAYAGCVRINGQLRHRGTTADVLDRLLGIGRLLEAAGDGLCAGDRIICGAICGGLLAFGDEVEVEVDDLGALRVTIGA